MILAYFKRCPIHPLYYITLTLILGIWCKSLYSWVYLLIPLFLIFFSSLWFISKKKNNYFPLIFCLAAFTFGAYRYNAQHESHALFYKFTQGNAINIIGSISSIERIEHPRFKYSILLETDKIEELQNKQHTSINRTIQIYTARRIPFEVQDKIYLKNIIIKQPSNNDINKYLIKEDIVGMAFISHFDYELMHKPSYSFKRWFFYFKQDLLDRCRKKLSRSTFALFASIFLGNRHYGKKYMEEPKDSCKTWGTYHYLARAGLHLVTIIFVWQFLLNFLPINFFFKNLFMLLLSILYFLLSWPSIAFVRAFSTFLFYKLCVLMQVSAHFFYILTLTCFLVLLHNPMQLFFLDFQLSFGITFALSWFGLVNNQKNLPNISKY